MSKQQLLRTAANSTGFRPACIVFISCTIPLKLWYSLRVLIKVVVCIKGEVVESLRIA